MSDINYARFNRIMKRCAEIAAEPGMDASVVGVYHGVLEGSADAYVAADAAMITAVSENAKESLAATEALAAFDAPYRVARSTVAAFVPGLELPETLKAQRTDTDKVLAVEGLLKALGDHTGEPWADTLLQGPFAQQADTTVKMVNQATAASTRLSHARVDRAAAYDTAYPRYLQFKRVVRDACGPKSKEYKRIHGRTDGGTTASAGTAPSKTAATATAPA